MAEVTLSVGGHFHTIACRDGEEAHLLNMGAIIDAKTVEARAAVGGLNEVRQLLFAALLLADELSEARKGGSAASVADPDPRVLRELEQMAARVEALASALEHSDV